jgi:CheY-like chemotaxis protein
MNPEIRPGIKAEDLRNGPKFCVALPIQFQRRIGASTDRPDCSRNRVERQGPPEISSFLTNPARILLAEADLAHQRAALHQLIGLGLQVDIANNASEALAKCVIGGRYWMILMACQMPSVNGFEATRRIREFEKQRGATPVCIVALAALAMERDYKTCLDAGMDDYITKPMEMEHLKRLLHRNRALRVC